MAAVEAGSGGLEHMRARNKLLYWTEWVRSELPAYPHDEPEPTALD